MEKTVLIVGASSGIGKSLAQKFIKKSYAVFNMSRSVCDVDGVTSIYCDISDEKSLTTAWREFSQQAKKLDILIYCVGFSMAAPLEYVKKEDYRYLFEVNFFGYIELLKRCIPFLKTSAGVSCAVSSTASLIPIAFDSFYSSSKAALNMLTFALRLELAPMCIKVLSVMPGATKTNFTFKRKEYSAEMSGEYADSLTKSANALAQLEQSGMTSEKVASSIFRKCTRATCSHLYATGIQNKIVHMLSKILPNSLIYLLAKYTFDIYE